MLVCVYIYIYIYIYIRRTYDKKRYLLATCLCTSVNIYK